MNPPVTPNAECGSSASHDELGLLYKELDSAVAALGPVCQLSGRCCRFGEYGHTLFVSAIEVQFLLSNAPEPEQPLDQGDTCPWQDAQNRCVARGARPLGCRVYFCDPTYQDAGESLSERFITMLKQLTVRHGLPWDYATLHRHLHEAREAGRFVVGLATGRSR
jgi:hypothetical protein